MGLLDEAIREHLELKRRRGGDPNEIAREEREALDPVFPGAAVSADGAYEDAAGADPAALGDPPAAEQEDQALESPAEPGEFSSVGEETAELDMESVLGAEADEMLTEEHHAPAAASASEHGPPELDPGQERLRFE
jgi:hypothetical protein